MEIRKAISSDLDQLAELFNQYRVFYKEELEYENGRKFISDRMTNGESEIFIADHNGRLAGFVQLYPIFSSTRMKRLWLLNDLFVLPEYRGQGVSIRLMDCCKELCKNTKACGLLLETSKSNTIGNQLYPKAGFELETSSNFYTWSVG